MSDSTLDAEASARSPIDFSALQRADASARRAPDDSASRGSLWLRVLVGSDHAELASLDEVPAIDRARLAWWALGLTPTARLRKARFREALDDRRLTSAAVAYARQAS